MPDEIEPLKEIVQRISGVRSVKPATRLYCDLGLAGDDAFELSKKVAQRLSVSFADCKFDRVFPQECEAFEMHFLRMPGFRSILIPVAMQHLAAIVDRKVWFDPAAASD